MPAGPVDAKFIRSTNVIAVADVVESVRLMEQDEQAFIGRWQAFVAFVQQILAAQSGRLHKSLGDGLMLEFSDPHGCLRAAAAMHAWLHDLNQGVPPEDQVQLRIGAHVAGFIADQYDIYGTDVNLAARIASLAGPGEIVISAALRERLAPDVQARLEDLGSCHLKHVKEPVHAFRLGQAGRAPVMPMRRLASHTLRPTVAVLPFGMEGEAVGGLSGEALADDIVAALARSELLQVASRLSTAPFGGGRVDLEELRRAVGAHYVLTGRARRHGADLSLFIELADARSGHAAWAQSFHGPVPHAALIEGRLMREVVSAVHSAVVARETERARGQPLPSVEGFTLLLAAIGLMHSLCDSEVDRARGLLEHLVEGWRGHPAPHAWLSHLHVLRLQQGTPQAPADAERARERALAAVQCDPGSAFALAVHGHALVHAAGDLAGAEEAYAQALAARPQDSLVLLLQAELQALQGHGESARAAALRACESFPIEPLRSQYEAIAAFVLFAAGDMHAAAALAQSAVQRNPLAVPAWRMLAAAQALAGEPAQARRAAARLLERQPAFTVAAFVAAFPGDAEVSQRLAHALLQAGAPAG